MLGLGKRDQEKDLKEKISQLENELAETKKSLKEYRSKAARYRTLYHNLLRRYRDLQEEE